MATRSAQDAENPQMNFMESGQDVYDRLFEGAKGKGVEYLGKSIGDYLKGLKNQVKTGNMTLPDYTQMVEGLQEPVTKFFNDRTTQGQAAGEEAKRATSFITPYFNWQGAGSEASGIKLPFTKQEYAKLPENVLPTKDQVTSGMFDETLAPIRRYAPTTPTGTTTADGKTVTLPGDPLGNTVVTDPRQRQIEEEALRQEEQSRLMAEQSKTARETQLTELADLLTKRSTETFNLEKPGMYEDLNTRGLLRSSALGDRLSTRAQELERENQNSIAQAKLGYGDANLTDVQNILASKQGFQTAGLQARLGLEDAEAQKQLAITLAELSKPKAASGKSSGEKWAQGISTAANVGTAIAGATK